MSRLWDRSEIYVRTEVDELLRDFPDTDVATLSSTFMRSHPFYERDPEFAAEIAAELRRRADAGVRYWAEPIGLDVLEREVRAIMASTAAALCVAVPADRDEPAEKAGYWWQRM
jgi:hypothetical protein